MTLNNVHFSLRPWLAVDMMRTQLVYGLAIYNRENDLMAARTRDLVVRVGDQQPPQSHTYQSYRSDLRPLQTIKMLRNLFLMFPI